jgi:hypothetical protein
VTPAGSYRALEVLLLILSAVGAVAGLALVFASGWLLSAAPPDLHLPASAFALLLLKLFGAVAFTFAYLSYAASRDPVRYLAVIDGLIFLMLAATVVDVYGLATLHVAPFYPGQYVLARAAIRLALAIALLVLRPRGAAVAAP